MIDEIDAGMKVEEVCRQFDISSATYYNRKSKCGGMEASHVRRLKLLEEENSILIKFSADVSLENNSLIQSFVHQIFWPSMLIISIGKRRQSLPRAPKLSNIVKVTTGIFLTKPRRYLLDG